MIQNTLFGDEGLGIGELVEIFKDEISEGKIRKSIKYLKENGILNIAKDGKKELFDINTKRLIEFD